jgi:hypothetical protein
MLFDRIYVTGVGVMGYAVVYLPLALFVTWIIYKIFLGRLQTPWLRGGAILSVTTTIISIPIWDVLAISREAARLCNEQAGMHIYRTVEADGFLGSSAIEQWSKFGFKYVENGGGEKMSRYTLQDGKIVHERIQQFASRYQAKTGENHVVINKHFARSSERVIDRHSGEVLGELVYFSIYPGRLDNLFIGLTGARSGFSPWFCGDEPPPGSNILRLGSSDVILATIKPHK